MSLFPIFAPVGGYAALNSGDFELSDSDHLTWTPGVGPTSAQLAVWATWLKRESAGALMYLRCSHTTSTDYFTFTAANKIDVAFAGGGAGRLLTTATYADTASWHHFCCSIDTTDGTAGNRMRLWWDGTEVTAFDTDTNPSLNYSLTTHHVSGRTQDIGRHAADGQYFDGLMTDIVDLDGQSIQNGDLTIADLISGGSPVDPTGLTYGTNGSLMQFQSSGAQGDDTSGNGNDYTNSGVTQSATVPT